MNQKLNDQISLQQENEKWKKLLQNKLFSVCKSMDPDEGLIDCLLSENVLNKRAAESCRTKKLKYDRSHAVLDIVMRRSHEDFVKLCKALCETGQIHIVEGFFNQENVANIHSSQSLDNIVPVAPVDVTDAVPGDPVPVFDWRDFIKKNLMVLIEVIDPDNGLITTLAIKRVIPDWATDKYTSREDRFSRAEALLMNLMHKGDSDYQKFCEALIANNQRHVVDDYLSHGAVGCYRHSLRRSQTCPEGVACKETSVLRSWKDVLVRQQSTLIDNMDPSQDLINHLERTGVMNRRCAERCREIKNEHERTTFILDFMRMRPDRDFSCFCQGLKMTNQQHIVDTYFKDGESTSTAVQESVSAPVTPLSQLGIGGAVGDGDQLQRERRMVAECQPQPLGDGDSSRNVGSGGQRVGAGEEELVVAVHPTEENTGQPVQEQGNISLIEDDDTLASCQGTKYEGVDLGYHSRPNAQPCDEAHLSAAEADQSWEPPSGDQSLGRNQVEYLEDSIYGSRPTSINNVKVGQSSQQFYTEHREMSYPMNKVCRGRCIIFNNQKFIRMRERTGTEVDSALLKSLFQKLLFKVDEVIDATAEKIRSKLSAVSQDRTLEKDQCLIIFVLSHGDFENGQCVMFGSDERTFSLEDVLTPFAPSNCDYMIGKPKLVFVQACRGEQYDYSQSDSPAVNEKHPSQPHVSYPDFLVGFPTQAGYRAFRDIEHGSWYINALTRTLMARAHNTSLNSMMNLIAGAASKWLSQTGNPETDNKTQYAIYTCSFTKDLFFFPGIFE